MKLDDSTGKIVPLNDRDLHLLGLKQEIIDILQETKE